MRELKDGVDVAIRGSGKTANQIAEALDVDPNTISRVRTGEVLNPGIHLLIGIARETSTTVGELLGEGTLTLSADDERELQRFGDWIDSKLATIDALGEPNAEIVVAAPAATADLRIADKPRQRVDRPFGSDADLVLRAHGESMIEDGILPGDTLYATPRESASEWPVGDVVACRSAHGIFVKRLVTEHGRRYLVSAHRRYRSIAVDASFELLGIVVGRVGRLA
jgi:transcriptional regulator with XRE-family HTH domain